MKLARALVTFILVVGATAGSWWTSPGPLLGRPGGAAQAATSKNDTHHRVRDTITLIQNVSPVANTINVRPGSLLAVQFSRPMVPLAAIGEPGRLSPVVITPRTAGQGHWVGTSLWALSGVDGLAGATNYTVRVPAGLTAQDGSVLAQDKIWSFQTARPGVVAKVPDADAQNVDPKTAIQITFNQPVDHASALAATTVVYAESRAAIAGTWNWHGQTMTLRPAKPLPQGSTIDVQVDTSLRATGGPLPMLTAAQWQFSVAGNLRVGSTEPNPDATGYDTNNGVTINFTAPIDPNSGAKAVTISPQLPNQWVNVSDDTLSISIGGAFAAATQYTITIGTGLKARYGGRLPAPYTLRFTTASAPPSLSFYNLGPVATFDAYRKTMIYASAVNVGRVHYVLYQPSQSQFMRMSSSDFDWSKASAAGMTTIRRWSVAVKHKPNVATIVGQQLLDGAGHALGSGFYYVTASDGAQASDHQLFLVTKTGLTLKVAQKQVLVWATDLQTGKPIAGMNVRVESSAGALVMAGTTGSDGVMVSDGHSLPGHDSLNDASLIALGRQTGDVSAVSLSWNSGISPWDYNLNFSPAQSPDRIYLYTERPIYRPGQPLYFRGVARADNDGRYTLLPAGTFVRVSLSDALGHTVFARYLRLSAAGTFSGQAQLGAAAALGDYSLTATIGSTSGYTSFSVAAYRKPTFSLQVTADHGEGGSYVQGNRITVHARAAYYFGAALGHAPVAWSVLSDDYFFSPAAHQQYDFIDSDAWSTPYQPSLGVQITQGASTTDAQGNTSFSLRADTSGHPLSQQLTIEATMDDAAHQTVSQRTQVIVHKGTYYLGLHPNNVVATTGQPQEVDLLALRPDGTSTVASVQVLLRVYRRSWYSVYALDPSSGSFAWQTRPHDTLLTQQVVHTTASGTGSVRFTPKDGGEYRITADTKDYLGNAIHSATYLWVGSDTYTSWGFANNDRLRLVADKPLYHTGDVAHILVPAPLTNMLALITLERGRVISHQVRRLSGNSVVLDVPITGQSFPDIYVSVVLVKGTGPDATLPTWKMGYLHLPVDQTEKALSVTITPDHRQASPGQRVSFQVHTSDSKGRPVAAEISLALVDAAVLALAQDQNASILDTFYADRELGVQTSETLALFVDRLNVASGIGAKGGGGGGSGGGHAPVRQQFPDTAYWNPRVTTNAQGNATVSMVLPDSLTTWTMVARGVTPDGLVGGGTANLVSSKSLLVNPALPRFLTLGDRARIGGVVVNNGVSAVRVRVSLTTDAGMVPVVNSSGVTKADGFTPREMTIAAGEQALVTWPAQGQRLGPSSINLTALALDGSGRVDRVTTSLPVEENSTTESVAAAGSVSASNNVAVETVVLPTQHEPGEGELTVALQPTLAGGLGRAAASLDMQTYNSTEQTTSRAVGEAVVARLPRSLTGMDVGLQQRVPDVETTAVQQLISQQHGDGGWGWWQEDASDPYMSAYVVDGLLTLRHDGVAVDGTVLSNAIDYLHGQLAGSPSDASVTHDPDLLAYIGYVLARAGHGDQGLTNRLLGLPVKLTPSGEAYVALALAQVTGTTKDSRVLTLLAALQDSAQLDATGTHWNANPRGWQTLDSTVGTTAIVLNALLTLDPSSPLITRAARWLLAARQGDSWTTAQQTALAVQALGHLAAASGETTDRYTYVLYVAGHRRSSGTVKPGVQAQESTVHIPLGDLPTTATTVRIVLNPVSGSTASIQGLLYYTLRMRYFQPVDHIAPATAGIAVTRSYQPVAGIAALGQGAPWAAGSMVRVTLTVVAVQDLYYVQLEDPLPAGAEGVDTSLQTTSATVSAALQTGIPVGTSDLQWFVSHSEVKDDRIALFADFLPAGTYTYSYLVHLTTAGTYHALPAGITQVYFPDVFGRSAGGYVTIH